MGKIKESNKTKATYLRQNPLEESKEPIIEWWPQGERKMASDPVKRWVTETENGIKTQGRGGAMIGSGEESGGLHRRVQAQLESSFSLTHSVLSCGEGDGVGCTYSQCCYSLEGICGELTMKIGSFLIVVPSISLLYTLGKLLWMIFFK